MKFPFFSKTTGGGGDAASQRPWPPTCVMTLKTLSFRANDRVYRQDGDVRTAAEFPDSFRTTSDGPPLDSDESAVIGGLRSDRLLFRPGESSSILEEAKATGSTQYDAVSVATGFNSWPPSNDAVSFPATNSEHPPNDAVSVTEVTDSTHAPDDAVSVSEATDNESSRDDAVSVVAIDSDDPYGDFRTSMAEMVAAHELKDWESLEELLDCYLRVNHSDNHGFIIAAFADLVVYLSYRRSPPIDERCSSSSTQNFSFTSPLSFSSSSTSPRPSSPENDDSIKNKEQ